jgi:hypothetical protein
MNFGLVSQHIGMLSQFIVILSLFVHPCICFHVPASNRARGGVYLRKKNNLSMKWLFSKGQGSLVDMGGIGAQGEYYYIQSKRPTLQAPQSALGAERTIPIFPRNQVLTPLGEEYLGVYEMRYRQLLHDVGEGGTFGHIYYSQENQKLALVGTIARVKKTERLDDGGIYALMEGIGRFYVRDIVTDKPYLRAGVQVFHDYTDNPILLDSLERRVFDEMRYSVKIMKLLYPQNNYTMNSSVMKYRPIVPKKGVRYVSTVDETAELDRRSKFSFATMDMLKTDPVTKILFLQEPVLAKRYSTMLKVLQESTAFLEGELRKRGLVTEIGLRDLRDSVLQDTTDLEILPSSGPSWGTNYVDNDWLQRPTPMD